MRRLRLLLCAPALILAACGGGGSSSAPPLASGPPAAATGTPAPTPTPLNSPVLFTDYNGTQVAAVNIYGTGSSYAQTITVSQDGYSGAFSVSGCSGVAQTVLSGKTLTVTGESTGTCVLQVTGGNAISAALPVSVTTSSAVIQ